MEIVSLGDSALVVRIRNQFQDAPEQTLNEVLRALRRIEDAHIPGVIELAPGYTTVAVFFDPHRVMNDAVRADHVIASLAQKIHQAISRGGRRKQRDTGTRVVEIPVCYEAEFALDLEEVSRQAQIDPTKIVDLHCAAQYRVNCIGFTPGFPFLSGLDKRLATPRRSIPRKEIPAGSVALAGGQTGIYPMKSPGGWNIIGRTPLRLFDPQKSPPALLHAGDRIRFRAITRSEFEALKR
jgi:inhibitor of KinA